MRHHEESQGKPQYNMATPPHTHTFLDNSPPPHFAYPPFFSKNFQTPPTISINFEKVNPPPSPLYEEGGGGVQTMISIAKTASKKIGALIRSMKFLSPEVAHVCISISLPFTHVWNMFVMSGLVGLVAT